MRNIRTECLSRGPSRRGAVLVLVAVALVGILSVAALSLDGGRMLAERRQVQAAADAAADAGAQELYLSLSTDYSAATLSTARARAFAIAAANGYASNGATSTVTVNTPPSSGAYAGVQGYVEVLVESRLARSFSGIFASGPISVRGRSVAAGTQVVTYGSVLVLDPKKRYAAKLKGKDSSLDLSGDLIINSKNKKALKLDKKFQIHADHILVAGGVEKNVKNAVGKILETGVNPTADPVAGLPTPAKGPSRKPEDYKSGTKDAETYNLQPGTYSKMKFEKNQQVNLAPGVYYLEGELALKGNATLTGDGVTIYIASKKELKFHTNGTVHLTPPTSGTYQGTSIFANPAVKSKVTFRKDTNLDISGMIYAPNAKVEFKQIDADLGGYAGERDHDADVPDDEADDGDDTDDSSPVTTGALGASIIARELSIDKKSHVTITGTNIFASRPLLGLVE